MLSEAALIPLLEPFFDQRSPQFQNFPDTQAQAAALWARAAAAHAAAVVPPCATVAAGEAAFAQALLPALRQGRRSALSEAWQALALVLATGMAPAWVAIPPITPLNLDPVFFLGEHGGSNRDCLLALARVVTRWLRTGRATQTGTALTVNWS